MISGLIGSAFDDTLTGDFSGNILNGGAGADILDGAGGLDILDGNDGDDTAVFSLSFGQYALAQAGNTIIVKGLDVTTTLNNIEHIQFGNGTLHLNDGSSLFDALYYVTHNPDVFNAGVDPLLHFNVFGWQEGRDPNAWFDTSGYLAVNKDVAAAGVNPLDHYHNSGWHEGRDPSANFDTTLYLINNPDVAAAGIDPLAHYLSRPGRRTPSLCGGQAAGEWVRCAVLPVPLSRCGGRGRRSAAPLQCDRLAGRPRSERLISTRPDISPTTSTSRQPASIRSSTIRRWAGRKAATPRRTSTRSVIWRPIRTSRRPA